MAKKKKTKSKRVTIPAPLFKKIEERIKETGFDSVSEYVAYVLREVASEEEEVEEESYSKEDEEKVKERLRALGYLG